MYNFTLKSIPSMTPGGLSRFPVTLQLMSLYPETRRMMEVFGRQEALFLLSAMGYHESTYDSTKGIHDPSSSAKGAFGIQKGARTDCRKFFPSLPLYPKTADDTAGPVIQIRYAAAYAIIASRNALPLYASAAKIGWITNPPGSTLNRKMLIGTKLAYQRGISKSTLPVANPKSNAAIKGVAKYFTPRVDKFLNEMTYPDFYTKNSIYGPMQANKHAPGAFDFERDYKIFIAKPQLLSYLPDYN